MRYQILLNILDKICEEAPSKFTSYQVDHNNPKSLDQIRSKAFIHLFLQVKYGMMDFAERHNLITEGPGDGGIDAYYIDKENKKLFLIQSKFRTNKKNFEQKKITADDLVYMEVYRILHGDKEDSSGNPFSSKIQNFQTNWSKVGNQVHYTCYVIILGNLENYTDEQIKKIINNDNYEVFDFDHTYKELVFPLCSGTYYDPKEIIITINLYKKKQPALEQEISTKLGNFPVQIVFVPTKEIGSIMLKYKNSILKYNPRNYLSLSKNPVNSRIMESIVINNSNDFAIYNNGITMIANDCKITPNTGIKNFGQILILNPQIINGGQTAYVLSEIYEKHENDLSIFDGKEVMLKVISLKGKGKVHLNLDFIERISNATNQQTKVGEPDRRSPDKIQIAIEEKLFEKFGYFYERKKGEFYNGIHKKYIDKSLIIDRKNLLKAYLAWQGNAADARRSGEDVLFKEERFKEIMKHYNISKIFFAYKILKNIEQSSNIKNNFGPNMKYVKMAIISVAGALYVNKYPITTDNVDEMAKKMIQKVLAIWDKFIGYVVDRKWNKVYISDKRLDYDNYFKGATINNDIKKFFQNKTSHL